MKPLNVQFGKKPDKAPRVSSLYLKLRSRFTAYFFLLVLLPYLLVAVAADIHLRSLAEKNVFHLARTSMEQEKNSIERYIGDLKLAAGSTAAFLSPGQQRSAAVTAKEGGFEEYSALLKEAVEEGMTSTQLRVLSAAYIIGESGILAAYGSESASAAISGPASQRWYHNAVTLPETVHVLGTIQRFYEEGKSRMVFSMAQAIPERSGSEPRSVVLFDFSYGLLSDFASGFTLAGRESERLILDFEGNVLYGRNQGNLTIKADQAVIDAMDSADTGFKNIYYGGGDCYMTYIRYNSLSWIFIDLIPTAAVMEGLWTGNPVMTALIFLLPVILFVYLALMLRLMNPINELTTVISDYESQLPGVSGQTPLLREKMSNTGVGAISDIDFLINKIYSIKLRQKEAELNSLQNQINPHFLYNTLESIRGAALYHGIHEIAAMSKALSLLFRYSISNRVLVSIKEELQHLENYISIQNFRYENKFELSYSVSPELLNYKILKLTLQPLIENSIKHGLEMKLGKGTIKVEILELDKNIKIQISDDGLGIPPKKVEELNRSIAYEKYLPNSEIDRSGTGIGVKNVNSRIKLYFGEQYGLKFREAPVGTTVEITLPAVTDN